MEGLQCIQRATLDLEENITEKTLPGLRRTTADVLPPHVISGANQAFVAPRIPQGTSALALGQVTGVQPHPRKYLFLLLELQPLECDDTFMKSYNSDVLGTSFVMKKW